MSFDTPPPKKKKKKKISSEAWRFAGSNNNIGLGAERVKLSSSLPRHIHEAVEHQKDNCKEFLKKNKNVIGLTICPKKFENMNHVFGEMVTIASEKII